MARAAPVQTVTPTQAHSACLIKELSRGELPSDSVDTQLRLQLVPLIARKCNHLYLSRGAASRKCEVRLQVFGEASLQMREKREIPKMGLKRASVVGSLALTDGRRPAVSEWSLRMLGTLGVLPAQAVGT